MTDASFDINLAMASVSAIRDLRSFLHRVRNQRDAPTPELEQLIGRAAELMKDRQAAEFPASWRILSHSLNVLLSHFRCIEMAANQSADIVAERTRLQVHLGELRAVCLADEDHGRGWADENLPATMLNVDSRSLAQFLLSLPLPPLYWKVRQADQSRFPIGNGDESTLPDPLLRLITTLDNAPLVSPRLVRPGVLYPLVFRLRGLHWPPDAERLRLQLITSCPEDEYSISHFELDRPASLNGPEFEAELKGHIRFVAAQSTLLEDLVFLVRAAFESSEGAFQDVPVIGHHELRLRVVDQASHPFMSGNQSLDRHVEELLTQLVTASPAVADEMPALLPIVTTLTRLLGTYAQEGIYKGRQDVDEKEFHRTVLRDLRLMLGPTDVTSHPNQAGGIPDIKYREVIIELKVEDEKGDRDYLCRKYTAQPAQYSGAAARQVSIVLVLDLTPKDQPIGDIRNDILITNVPTHGGDDADKPFPSKAIVFVLNGNVRSPSDYSR